jgi:Bifunctional DNA primase/polymerase, N-terminal
MFPSRLLPHIVRRAVLRRAASRYAMHGWDVVPGAYLAGTRFRCEQPGCHTVACHPAVADWEAAAGHDVAAVRASWQRLPHGVLLATGGALDALEVPAGLGRFALGGAQGPVVVAPSGRWLFLVRAGESLRAELQWRSDVVLHSRGSWIAVPPTPLPGGRMRWEVDPDEVGWRLPESYALQVRLLTGVRTLVPPLAPRTAFAPAA